MAEQAKTAGTGAIKISFQEGSSFERTNPFEIAASLRQLVGVVTSARPTPAGALLVKLRNPEQAAILLQQDGFLSKPATFSIAEELKYVEAYSYAPILLDVSTRRIVKELAPQGIIGASRLRPKDGVKNPGLRLRVQGVTVPPKLQVGFD